MKLQFLPLILAVSSVRSIPRDVIPDTTQLPVVTTEVAPTYDYIVEIGFNLDESKVPAYLVNVIYDQATVKSITTDDILTLFGLTTIDRTTILTILEKLNISTQKLFSLDGFDKFLTELSIDFKEFYNKVIIDKLNITGNPLRDVLVSLDIDNINFSMGMAYGDPNPYDEFKKGTFTKESVTTALEKADRTMDDLFIACRDHFLNKALTLGPEKITGALVKYQFDKATMLALWNELGITIENVYAVPGFQQLLTELSKELNKVPCLGVLTATSNITINKITYETWSGDGQIVQPYAESILRKFQMKVSEKIDTDIATIHVLKASVVEPYGDKIPFIEIGKKKGAIANCKLVTLENDSLVTFDVVVEDNHAYHMHVAKGNITDLLLGSPLICENKLYGLTREIREDEIVIDSFSGARKVFINFLSVFVIICAPVLLL